MPAEYLAPGVYVQESIAGFRAIEGVDTSTTVFIGRTLTGAVETPVTCVSFAEFARSFGDRCADGDMARAVRLFFANGGARCIAVRIGATGTPVGPDYERAYAALDRAGSLVNMLVLPRDRAHDDATACALWGAAGAWCVRRQALLIADAPVAWNDPTTAADAATALRKRLPADHVALYMPRLLVDEDGKSVVTGPSGAIAGLIGRFDAARGVWKATAGNEADVRGVTSLESALDDAASAQWQRSGINLIRRFPQGVVCWGARTLAGADDSSSEYRYVPVRRLAWYIEQSLTRGLQWAVFEPNDERLWASLRLAVNEFLQRLFRQGAFQGQTSREAYLVRCDGDTTSAQDRARGIVNVHVGFAPLKPAEFVQMKLELQAAAAP